DRSDRGPPDGHCPACGPLSARNVDLTQQGVLSFNTPRELAVDLAQAGYDGCDFASNHTMDRGLPGLMQTQAALTAAGLGHAGPSAEEEEAGRPELYEAGCSGQGPWTSSSARTSTCRSRASGSTGGTCFTAWATACRTSHRTPTPAFDRRPRTAWSLMVTSSSPSARSTSRRVPIDP
ncbi:MAG: CapA family protein, partial [Ornithinimicrobium sp.]